MRVPGKRSVSKGSERPPAALAAAPVGPLMLALALATASAGCAKKGAGAGGGGGFQMPPMPVEVTTAARETVRDRFEAVGTVQAGEAVTVVSEIAGVIVDLPFREGEAVRAGALLARLDDAEPAAAAKRAEAWRDQTRTSYERVKTIVEKNAGSRQALDDAETALEMAEADLALARARLAKARITAPFSGTVGIRRVSPGAYVRPGDALTDLVQTDEMRVLFSAPERYVSLLAKGTPVKVSTLAYPGDSPSGKIDVVDATIDPDTRSVRVLARVPNPDGRLRAGMSADVTAILSERPDAVTVSDEAVFAEGDRFYVYVVNPDSTVARAALTLGTRLPAAVEVLSGLEPGTRVVRAGHQKLHDGARVIPIEGGAPAAPGPEGGASEGSR